jgi:hypothetical protein
VKSNRRYSRAFTTIGVSLISTFAAAGGIQVASATIAAPAINVPAHTARVLKATDTAKLRYVSAAGASLREEGPATGTLPGKMRVSMDVGTTFSGTFTIYLKGGTITGHGTATPHGVGVVESFAGTLAVTKGTGRYSHAGGRAGLYGTFNRNSYALTIQTTGNLSY